MRATVRQNQFQTKRNVLSDAQRCASGGKPDFARQICCCIEHGACCVDFEQCVVVTLVDDDNHCLIIMYTSCSGRRLRTIPAARSNTTGNHPLVDFPGGWREIIEADETRESFGR